MLVAVLSFGGAAALIVWHRRAEANRPPAEPRRLLPGEGPTVPAPKHPGDPARFRGARTYRRTGSGKPEPHRRRPTGR